MEPIPFTLRYIIILLLFLLMSSARCFFRSLLNFLSLRQIMKENLVRWIYKHIPTSGPQFSSMQSLSRVQLFATPWVRACKASLTITNSWSLRKLMSISQWCHPNILSSVIPFSSCPPNPYQHQGIFQWVNTSHEMARVLEFQLQHQSFQWTPRTDFL